MEAHLQLTFAPMWPSVREIRQRVGAALMPASERVENAIKYGESVGGAQTVTFVLDVTPAQLSIRVVNGSTNAQGVAELERRVEELRSAPDKQALYLTRLEQLLADADESGKLGIY